jgi:hypothetical protein
MKARIPLFLFIGALVGCVFIALSTATAATSKNVNCGQSISSVINGDSKTTATRFVLEAGLLPRP